ncbi:BspA family leucine-rich repeat surface protein [Listeria monocytogenes]|uniref:BspA family leucine-rich repeat surface protein n=1 Tax=Listeria monocytogenes TaxID=1639 RepID=UPI0011EADE16|nr:BspA family leucine-rich repeat surface protein [Listeria monocytogenes]TYV58765.1 BspA family leucine-rich repeat surface protein [Listeria monocytogenes]TYV60088.1 BspA family leucine-rich repeat surface protein [Listeria monocytogenes]
MKNLKKSLRQIVVILLLLYIIGLPMQNIILANTNEPSTTEKVITDEIETNTSNSESAESEIVPTSEEGESTVIDNPTQASVEITPSETRGGGEDGATDDSEVNFSEKAEASSANQQSEERPSTKAVTSGGFPNGSTATWNFDDTTGTLTISGGTLVGPSDGSILNGIDNSIQGLTGIDVNRITDIVLEDKVFASGSCDSLFEYSRITSLDLSNFDTSQATNMRYMFFKSSMTSLDLSNFDTSKVTDMSWMFSESATASLDLSSFDTSSVTSMRGMFSESAATSIDVSSFDTSKVTDMHFMFAAAPYSPSSSIPPQLQNITLGSQFQFFGSDAMLPHLTSTAKYTGKWQNVGNGTVNDPKGVFAGTATELMSTYDGSTMADTYVWQPTLLEVNVQDSVLMVGDTWNPADNFLSADNTGNPVEFKDIIVTGSVNTTQPGVYSVDYSYGSMTSTATITVLETMPASWINFSVDGTNVRSIPGSALSTPEWNLTTGLWDKWKPGIVKVPTDKLPAEPAKQGYEFKGWEDNTGTIVDFNTLDLDLNSQNEFNFYAVFEKVNSTNPSVEPPTKPGEGPNVVSPTTPGSGGNQTPSNGSGLNVGNTTITSQGNITTTSPATSQGGKLAKLGENSSLLLQGFGLLMVISGIAFFWWKRRKAHS